MLSDAIAAELPVLRAEAEANMASRCTVFTPGDPNTDPVTFEVTGTQVVVWQGPCRVRPADSGASTLTVGGAEAFTFDYLVSIPFAVDVVTEGQRVTVTDSPDPALVGVTLEIRKVYRGDQITARRLACSEVI